MKKSKPPLVLRRQTLREIADRLDRAAGGFKVPHTMLVCQVTHGCYPPPNTEM